MTNFTTQLTPPAGQGFWDNTTQVKLFDAQTAPELQNLINNWLDTLATLNTPNRFTLVSLKYQHNINYSALAQYVVWSKR